MILDVANFLLPQIDAIQITFGLLIFGPLLLTIFMVRRDATPARWESHWNGSTQNDNSDDLDAGHGSVTDICHVVATKAEQMAEIMPGILLIIGLLGTFLGLGLALNKASTILVGANSGAGMDDAMVNLMGMMQGLGTKFKTSTWGILAFLALKSWSAANGYEERRLRWCIKRMKLDIDSAKQAEQSHAQTIHSQLLQGLQSVSAGICSSLEKSFSVSHQLQEQGLAGHAATQAELRAASALLTMQIEKSTEISTTIEASGLATQSTLANAFAASQKLQQSSLEGHSATQAEIRTASALLEIQIQKSIAIEASSQAAQVALESFVEANQSNISAMQGSASQMATAASDMGHSAVNLQSAIQSFKDNVADVMTIMKEDLGRTIQDMNESFGENMGQIAVKLSGATTDISVAVDTLSRNVGDTMGQVEKSIKGSVDIQQKAHAEFLLTSETLNTQVTEMTNLVTKLSDDITAGLAAVSESGRRMVRLDDRYKAISESAEISAKAVTTLIERIQENAEKTASAVNDLTLQLKTDTASNTDAGNARRAMVGSLNQLLSTSERTASAVNDLTRQIKVDAVSGTEASNDRRAIVSSLHQLLVTATAIKAGMPPDVQKTKTRGFLEVSQQP